MTDETADDGEKVDPDQELIDRIVQELSWRFESVRIFATKTCRGGGRTGVDTYERGTGNFYATLGQVREWLIMQDHRARKYVESLDSGGDD